MMYRNDNGAGNVLWVMPKDLGKYKILFEVPNRFTNYIIPAEVPGYDKINRTTILDAFLKNEITLEDAQYLQVCRYDKECKSLCKMVINNGDVINFITAETGKYMFDNHIMDKSLNPFIPVNYMLQYNNMNANGQMMGYTPTTTGMPGYQCYPNAQSIAPMMFSQPIARTDVKFMDDVQPNTNPNMFNPSNGTSGIDFNPSNQDVMDYMKLVRDELASLIDDSKNQIMDNTLDTVMSMKLINENPAVRSAEVDLTKAHLNKFDSVYTLESMYVDDSELSIFRNDMVKLKAPAINMLKGLGRINIFTSCINDNMHMNFYNLFLRLLKIKGTIKLKDLEEILKCYSIHVAHVGTVIHDISGEDLYNLINRAINVYGDAKKEDINSNDCIIGLMTGLASSLLETEAIKSIDNDNEKVIYSRFVMVAMICGYIKATGDFLHTEMNNTSEYLDLNKIKLYSYKVFRMIVRPIDDIVFLTTPDHTMFLELGFYGVNLIRNKYIPVDVDSLWYIKSEAERFAEEDARAYAGMQLDVYDENTETATQYVITENRKLKQIKDPIKIDKRIIEDAKNKTLKVCDIICNRDISDIAYDVPEFAVGFFKLF